MGVGLNSGPIMSGQHRLRARMEYTTIGDTVNTASRLEGMTKGTPYPLFLSDSTRELMQQRAGRPGVRRRARGARPREKVKVWSIFGLAAADVEAAIVEPQLIPQTA